MQNKKLIRSSIFPFVFVVLIWLVKLTEYSLHQNWYTHGVFPRTFSGLQGVLLSPLLHGSFEHLISNTVSLFVLLGSIFYFYRTIAYRIFLLSYIIVGIWVWILARESYHIGASGLIYAFFGFLVFSGILRKQRSLLAISLLTIFLYGSMVWGVFPREAHVSWESHLFGFFTGLALAYYYKNEESTLDKPYLYTEEDIDYEHDFWNDVIEK